MRTSCISIAVSLITLFLIALAASLLVGIIFRDNAFYVLAKGISSYSGLSSKNMKKDGKINAIEDLPTFNASYKGPWFRMIGGNISNFGDYAHGIAASDDSVYLTGHLENHIFVACMSTSNGDFRWFKTLGLQREDAYSITAHDDRIYITGNSLKDNESGIFVESDVFVACLSASDGSLQWFKIIGGERWEEAFGISEYGGNIYVCGYTESFGAGSSDAFIACLSSLNGSLQWFKTVGGKARDGAYGISIYRDCIYIAGASESFGAAEGDIFVASLSVPNGDLQWFETMGSKKAFDGAWGIDTYYDRIYIVGETGIYTSMGSGFAACMLASNGSLDWFKALGTTTAEDVWIYNSSAYITGYGGILGFEDAFVTCLSASDGSLQWSKTIGRESDNREHASDITVFKESIYVAGTVFVPGPSFADAYCVKLSLDHVSSYDPADLEWTTGETWLPILVSPAQTTATSQYVTITSQQSMTQTSTPTETTPVLTVRQPYFETHVAALIPPTVSVRMTPLDFDILEGMQTVTSTVTAYDTPSGGIVYVRLYIDSSIVGTWTTEGTHNYTARFSPGTHTYYVEAADKTGNIIREPAVGSHTFTVAAMFPWKWILYVLIVSIVAFALALAIRHRRKQR